MPVFISETVDFENLYRILDFEETENMVNFDFIWSGSVLFFRIAVSLSAQSDSERSQTQSAVLVSERSQIQSAVRLTAQSDSQRSQTHSAVLVSQRSSRLTAQF